MAKSVCKTNLKKALNESYETAEILPINEHYSVGITVGWEKFDAVFETDGEEISELHCTYGDATKKDIVDYVTDHFLVAYDEHRTNLAIDTKSVDLEQLLRRFNETYQFLYEHYDKVAGYDEAMRYGDWLIKFDKELVGRFVEARHDVLSSDREVAAFGFVVRNMVVEYVGF